MEKFHADKHRLNRRFPQIDDYLRKSAYVCMKILNYCNMAYIDFTMSQLIDKFGLIEKKENVIKIEDIKVANPSHR